MISLPNISQTIDVLLSGKIGNRLLFLLGSKQKAINNLQLVGWLQCHLGRSVAFIVLLVCFAWCLLDPDSG